MVTSDTIISVLQNVSTVEFVTDISQNLHSFIFIL